MTKNMNEYSPRQQSCHSARNRAVQHVVKKYAPGQPDEQRLNQKRSWSVRKRKVAIGNLAEGDPMRILEDVTQVPKHREPRVLPQDDRSGAYKECRCCGPVPERPAFYGMSLITHA